MSDLDTTSHGESVSATERALREISQAARERATGIGRDDDLLTVAALPAMARDKIGDALDALGEVPIRQSAGHKHKTATAQVQLIEAGALAVASLARLYR